MEDSLNALFENVDLFTINGFSSIGKLTTLDKYPASNLIAREGAKYLQLLLPLNTIILEFILFAT